MNTLKRLKTIVRRRKQPALVEVGGELKNELQKHLNTLDRRIAAIKLGRTIAQIDRKSWDEINQRLDKKRASSVDDLKKLQSLNRLVEIAYINTNEAETQVYSYEGKVEELAGIRQRVIQAMNMIDVENNIRSVTAMYGEGRNSGQQTAANLELETREIRRLLHTTDGLIEISS